jgi:hypothetical protein
LGCRRCRGCRHLSLWRRGNSAPPDFPSAPRARQWRRVNVVRTFLAGLSVACVTAVPWAWSGCTGGDNQPLSPKHDGAATSDSTVCIASGGTCSKAGDCCSRLCSAGQCADPSPPVPPLLVCDADAGTYLGRTPVQGESCPNEGVACEFGSSPVVQCDTVATCRNGQWQISSPDSTDPACAPSADSCPLAVDAASVEQPCPSPGIHCDYAGLRCDCAQNASVAGWPAAWKCMPPPEWVAGQCPYPRPRLGTLCQSPGALSCGYGACRVRGAQPQVCASFTDASTPQDAGRWVEQPSKCSCPATPPPSNTPCENAGLLMCEYGSSPVQACNTTATCIPRPPLIFMSAATPVIEWTTSVADGSFPCTAAPASQCPFPGQRIQGMTCNTPSLECDYPDKRCECASGPAPQSGTTWRCTDPLLAGPGCGPRQPLGAPCPQQGLVCNYGVCDVTGGSAQACFDVWRTANVDPPCQAAACPTIPPEAGSLCYPGSHCEYGTSNVSACDTIAVCGPYNVTMPLPDGGMIIGPPPFLPPPPLGDGMAPLGDAMAGPPPMAGSPAGPPSIALAGLWNVSGPDGGGSCQPTARSGCPASFDRVPRGADCDGGTSFCDYPQGRCRCAMASGSAAPTWSCQDPTPPCPEPRPRLGSACTQEGLVCAYGPCGGADSETQMCRGGWWASLTLDCSQDAASLFGAIDAATE